MALDTCIEDNRIESLNKKVTNGIVNEEVIKQIMNNDQKKQHDL